MCCLDLYDNGTKTVVSSVWALFGTSAPAQILTVLYTHS